MPCYYEKFDERERERDGGEFDSRPGMACFIKHDHLIRYDLLKILSDIWLMLIHNSYSVTTTTTSGTVVQLTTLIAAAVRTLTRHVF